MNINKTIDLNKIMAVHLREIMLNLEELFFWRRFGLNYVTHMQVNTYEDKKYISKMLLFFFNDSKS